MDERLEKALDFSNYRLTIETQKVNLKTRIETLQTIMYQNGIWKADPTTISFVHSLIENEINTSVLIDSRGNPFQIDDLRLFKVALIEAYNSAMNEFLVESQKLTKARNIKKLMDWQ